MGGFLLVPLSRHFLLIVFASLQLYYYHPLHAQSLSWAASDNCNLYEGSWVPAQFDYAQGYCPEDLVPENRDCSKRQNKEYLNYKWQPTGCDLPRFDAIDFVQKHKGKTVMFVGDSISDNQWISLACLIFRHYESYTRTYTHNQQDEIIATYIFFHEPKITIAYQLNRFLVDVLTDSNNNNYIVLDSISSEYTQLWSTADILVFNSYHWWTHTGSLKPWEYLQYKGMTISTMDHMNAYELGLKTWAKWVDTYIDPQKTRVFFQGISALHLNYQTTLNGGKIKDCTREIEPIKGSTFLGKHYQGEVILKQVLSTVKIPITFMDITLMTQLRPDAHPQWFKGTVDCSHYCIPGVPDVWNQLMYASLISL